MLPLLLAGCQSAHDPQRIIDQCIETHGGDRYRNCRIEFDFRTYHLSLYQRDGQFEYRRTYTDSTGARVDEILTNKAVVRQINGRAMALDSAQRSKYSNAVNAVSYFVLLPYKLSDRAVIKAYAGETTIDGQVYDKIRVSFSKDGGGKDFQDVFFYWINQTSHTMDYLAYSEGGPRFRKAINPQTVGGIRFQDYVNYKGDDADSAVVGTFDQKYREGTLTILSQIEQKNIKVTPVR
ncbi:MAG: hypothetical protein H7Z72_14100 [Bacteroidetes bacterium]|nr:hypothetical protein [Fibrella sp.]